MQCHGNFLPGVEAQVPQFQKRLEFGAFHEFDNGYHFVLEVDEALEVGVDFILQVQHLHDNILHPVDVAVVFVRRHLLSPQGSAGSGSAPASN